MAATEVNKYLTKRYSSWLEFAIYHATRAGIPSEANDILDEVILCLLKKSDDYLLEKCRTPSKCGRYHEIDILALRMIKLNCYSDTAPYRAKFKPIPNAHVNLCCLNIADITEPENDISELVFNRFEQVREVFDGLQLCKKAKTVFEFKFFQDQPFRDWKGTETKKQLYDIYKQVENLIKEKIQGKTLL